jgi:hypothetical protein
MKSKKCHKCGKTLEKIETGLKVRTEFIRPDDCYDGGYKYISFWVCRCWRNKKDRQ